MPEAPSFVDQYTQQLGIMWRVNRVNGQVDRPSIISDPQERTHTIMLPPGGVAPCDVAHELIHASWAERLDPIFSTVFFDPVVAETEDAQAKMQMVYYAQQLIDVWVADRMAQLDSRLVQQDVATFTESMLRVPNAVYTQSPLEVMLGSAMNQAQITRQRVQGFNNKQKQIERRVEDILGRPNARITKKLTDLYTNLPQLSSDKQVACAQFQQQTQQSARILGFPIEPRLVESNGRTFWTI